MVTNGPEKAHNRKDPPNMSNLSGQPEMIGLALVHRLVADHGDALRFSLSKKGRIWLTLTHWDSEKYNTSVELDSFSEVQDVLNALAVVGVAHYGKCFRSMAHADSWHGVDATRS